MFDVIARCVTVSRRASNNASRNNFIRSVKSTYRFTTYQDARRVELVDGLDNNI